MIEDKQLGSTDNFIERRAVMIAEERKAIISLLKKDEIKNITMLNFMESYPAEA